MAESAKSAEELRDEEGAERNASDRNQKYRSRAFSVAGLTAAAAGALAAGLVLSPPETLLGWWKFTGLSCLIALVIATAAFVVASLVHARTSSSGSKVSWARPWQTYFRDDIKGEDVDHATYMNRAETVLDRILRATEVGIWSAGVAGVLLILTLGAIAFQPAPTLDVFVRTYDVNFSQCPAIGSVFPGVVDRAAFEGPQDHLVIRVNAGACGRQGSALVMVSKSDATFVVLDPP